MKAFFKPAASRLGGDVVAQANEQDIKIFIEEIAKIGMVAHAVRKNPVVRQVLLADRNNPQIRMGVDKLPPALADDAVTGNADL